MSPRRRAGGMEDGGGSGKSSSPELAGWMDGWIDGWIGGIEEAEP